MKKFVLFLALGLLSAQFAYAGKKATERKVANFGDVKGSVVYQGPTEVCIDGKCESPNWVGTMHVSGDAAKAIFDKMTVGDKDATEKVGKNILCKVTGTLYDCSVQIDDVREGIVTTYDGYTPTAKK